VGKDTQLKVLQELMAVNFLPNVSIIGKTLENEGELKTIAEFTSDYSIKEDMPTYYLCENHACMAPTTDIRDLEKLLDW